MEWRQELGKKGVMSLERKKKAKGDAVKKDRKEGRNYEMTRNRSKI